MARQLKPEQWAEIKIRYEFGDNNVSIAKDFNISETAIRLKAKSGGWTRKLREKVIDLDKHIEETSKNYDQIEVPFVVSRLENEFAKIIEDKFVIQRGIMNLSKGALNIHGQIVKNTLAKIQTGKISDKEASVILNNQGLSISSIAKSSGLNIEDSRQIQNKENENEDNSPVKFYIPDNGRDS